MSKAKAKSNIAYLKKHSKWLLDAFGGIYRGRIISGELFWKYKASIFCIVLFAIFYVTMQYRIQMQTYRITELNKELKKANTNLLKASSQYHMSLREKDMQHISDSLHLSLEQPSEPAFIIEK